MGKATRISGLVVAGLLSFSGLAAPVQSDGEVSIEDCELLGERAFIALSKDVKASYVCNMLAGSISLATCHKYGRKKAVLSDGTVTTTGIVYRLTSGRTGAQMTDTAGCPNADDFIPDEMVVSEIE